MSGVSKFCFVSRNQWKCFKGCAKLFENGVRIIGYPIPGIMMIITLIILFHIPSFIHTFPTPEDNNNPMIKSSTLLPSLQRNKRDIFDNFIWDGVFFPENQEFVIVKMDDTLDEIPLEEVRRKGLICNLCFVVDQQFADAYNLTESQQIEDKIKRIVDRVSWIFRNVDWKNDGTPDNIGFDVINVTNGWIPYPEEKPSDYDKPSEAVKLLNYFSHHDFHHCCLGVGFTNRLLENNQTEGNYNQIGISYTASDNMVGGMCERRRLDKARISSNVILISARAMKDLQLSERDLGNVLLHEIGHTFGVDIHDMDMELKASNCSGYDPNLPIPPDYIGRKEPPNGRYIMWGVGTVGIEFPRSNNLDYSLCSKEAVVKFLFSGNGIRRSCLVLGEKEEPFCGNGIVEPPEQCDCGNEASCWKNPCHCGIRGSRHACTLLKGTDKTSCELEFESRRKRRREQEEELEHRQHLRRRKNNAPSNIERHSPWRHRISVVASIIIIVVLVNII